MPSLGNGLLRLTTHRESLSQEAAGHLTNHELATEVCRRPWARREWEQSRVREQEKSKGCERGFPGCT